MPEHRRHRYVLGALLGACAAPPPLAQQTSIQAHLVVHVDPLARGGGQPCETEGLTECGRPVASSWEQRSRNLLWLTETWSGRALDLQVGPEAALAWSGDPTVQADLARDMSEGGDADGVQVGAAQAQERVADVAASVRAALAGSISQGDASLGVHVHSVLPDASGAWGAASKRGAGPGPCEAWADEAQGEPAAAIVESVAVLGAQSVDALAQSLPMDAAPTVWSYTGHLPRSMAGKAQLVADPEALDPAVERGFPAGFQPLHLGSAYSECMQQAVDHPVFELWPAHDAAALAGGAGPLVVPGLRVVGSMAEHLDAPANGAAAAGHRRLLQLLLNWRTEALSGRPARPWAFSFHEHLFDLNPGEPGPLDPTARDLHTREGSSYRGDLASLMQALDGLAGAGQWHGVAAAEGAVLEWTLPTELGPASGGFSYGDGDAPPPTDLDRAAYPYLPLPAEVLAQSHMVCAGASGGVGRYGLLRCDAGWGWGLEARPGFSCLDAASPAWVVVLVPDEGAACVDDGGGSSRAGAVDGTRLGPAERCGDGALAVPVQGLLVEPAGDPGPLLEGCAALP